MPKKRISEQIVRNLLIESGHRCAVCGEAIPLERAHIVPWKKGGETKVEDLICLCSSCHERADSEGWGEKALATFKARPWSSRRHDPPQPTDEPRRARVTITLNSEHLDIEDQKQLEAALSAFLKISPDSVQIVTVKKG